MFNLIVNIFLIINFFVHQKFLKKVGNLKNISENAKDLIRSCL